MVNNKKKIKLLGTGFCGFVGHHICEHFLKHTDWDIIILDKLTYASSGFDRLRDISVFDNGRVKIFTVDLQEPISEGVKQEIGEVDYIINMASESHVDNSIKEPVNFILNNVKLVLTILEWARGLKTLKKFVQFSTDEVYSTAPEGVNYVEGSRHNPGNPYSASKAAQEDICMAYANSYKLPIVITNGMNIFGERQHPEKFIPLIIAKVLKGEKLFIHSNADKTKAGTRFYIHARNVARAIHFIFTNTNELLDKIDASKGKYNIVGEKEVDNLEMAQMIAKIIGKPLNYEMVDFHSSRPGHDLRYSISGEKMYKLGWRLSKNFESSLAKTIEWYLKPENKKWLDYEI